MSEASNRSDGVEENLAAAGDGELGGATTPAGADPELVAKVIALRDRLSLTNIRMQKLFAEALADPPWEPDAIHVSSQPPEFRVGSDSLACRFEQSVELIDAANKSLARASACALVEFTLDGEPDADALALFVQENGYFIAYPYLRQAIHDLTARLGFDAVVLGVLARGRQRPNQVALVRPLAPSQPAEVERTTDQP
jgi:hypothetical protein